MCKMMVSYRHSQMQPIKSHHQAPSAVPGSQVDPHAGGFTCWTSPLWAVWDSSSAHYSQSKTHAVQDVWTSQFRICTACDIHSNLSGTPVSCGSHLAGLAFMSLMTPTPKKRAWAQSGLCGQLPAIHPAQGLVPWCSSDLWGWMSFTFQIYYDLIFRDLGWNRIEFRHLNPLRCLINGIESSP